MARKLIRGALLALLLVSSHAGAIFDSNAFSTAAFDSASFDFGSGAGAGNGNGTGACFGISMNCRN